MILNDSKIIVKDEEAFDALFDDRYKVMISNDSKIIVSDEEAFDSLFDDRYAKFLKRILSLTMNDV